MSILLVAGTVAGSAKPAQPMVRVARVPETEVPRVDGRGDEPIWRRTVAIQDFQTLGAHSPAAEGTTVRFAYDAKHLYVLAVCEESLLNVATQRMHEVRMAAKEHDGSVFEDDSLLLILRLAEGESYELAVNPLGTLADARSKGESLWAGRDFAWESGAKVAATVQDGYWEMEMAIPWSSFEGGMPNVDDAWEVVLARVARGRQEFTSWNPSGEAGLHAPEAFGRLLFGEALPGMRLVKRVQELTPGANAMELVFEPHGEGATMLTTSYRSFGKEEKRQLHTKLEGREPVKQICPIEVAEPGVKPFAWSVRDAGSLQPLYTSPTIHLKAVESFSELRLSAAGRYTVFVNGAKVAEGQDAEGVSVRLPLARGANALAVRAEGGVVDLRLEGGKDVRWRYRMGAVTDEEVAAGDDRGWSWAPATGEGALGKAGEPAVFRHTLLYDQTRLFPSQHPTVCLATGIPQFLTFTATGLAGQSLRGWRAELKVPAFVKVREVTGFYAKGNARKARFTVRKLGEDANEARYEVAADAALPDRAAEHPLFQIFQISLMAEEMPGEGRYALELASIAEEGAVTEVAQRWELSFLPKPQGRQPEKLTWLLWGGAVGATDDMAFRRDVLRAAQAVGFNEITAGDLWTSEAAPEYGIRNHIDLYFKESRVNLKAHLKERPEDRLITAKGEPSDYLMCMSRLLDEGWPVAAGLMKELLLQRKVQAVSYDYEYGPLTGPHSCYCPECTEEFRAFAKLSEKVNLTPEVIRDEHAAAWVDFMARRVAKLFRKMREVVNALPGAPLFSVYSGYQTEDNAARYGVDWRYVAEEDAADVVACGYGRPLEAIGQTLKVSGETPVMTGELLIPYLTREALSRDTPIAPTTKARLLRLMLDGTGGLLVYDRHSLDGRSWWALAEVSRLVAEEEALFLMRRLEGIDGVNEANGQLLRGEDHGLLFLMNPSAREASFSFALPAGYRTGREFYTGAEVKAGERVAISLPPGEAAVYRLTGVGMKGGKR